MLTRFLTRWLPLVMLLSLFAACGGGDDSSGFFEDTYRPPTEDSGGPTTPESMDVTVLLTGSQLIPTGGSTTFTMITFEKNESAQSISDLVIEPNVTFSATVTGQAKVSTSSQTDNRGQATITVSHASSENVLLTIQGTGKYQGGFTVPLYFGASFTADITTSGVIPADGVTGAQLLVSARDSSGKPIQGIAVETSFSEDSFAVAATSPGSTDTKGQFTTTITDTIPQTVSLIPIVGGIGGGGGLAGTPLPITFSFTKTLSVPSTLYLRITNDNATADGKAKATLLVIAQDSGGSPIPNVPVEIASDSSSAVLSLSSGEASGLSTVVGNTGSEGKLEVNVTETTSGRVVITASTSGLSADSKITKSQVLTFLDVATVDELEKTVKTIELNVINSGQPADGTSQVNVTGRVLDQEDAPLGSVALSIIASGGSAQFTSSVTSDVNGFFTVSFTNNRVESFSVKAFAGKMSSNPVTVSFVTVPKEPEKPGEEEKLPTVPTSVSLLASPQQQVVDDGSGTNQIALTAIVRDSNSVPMKDVTVSIAAVGGQTANTAVFDIGVATTGDGGTAAFKVSNTVEGYFDVSATASVKDSKGNVVGSVTLAQPVRVTFTKSTLDVTSLTVTDIGNPQIANGEDPIKLQVVARDSQNRPVSGVPIILQFAGAAIAKPIKGITDEDSGLFVTEVTSSRVETVNVTVAVEGISNVPTQTVKLEFLAASPQAAVTSVELEVLPKDDNGKLIAQPADGESKITLLAIPRDNNGAPVPGVTIEFVSTSSNISEITGGTTNALGELRASMTSNVAEEFFVTAIAKFEGGQDVKSTRQTVTFASIGIVIHELSAHVVNDRQIIGDTPIKMEVFARGANGEPIANAPIVVGFPTSTIASANPSRGVTDENGVFITEISSTIAGEVTVNIAVAGTGLAHPPLNITFLPKPGSSPTTIELLVLNAPQPANAEAKINLVVTTKDSKGNPISGIEVELLKSSSDQEVDVNDFTIAESTGTTNALGEFRTTIVTTRIIDRVSTINITPVAKPAEGASITGKAVPVTFTSGTPIPDTLTLSVVGSGKGVGEEAELIVLARKSGSPLNGVPVILSVTPGDNPPDVSGSAIFGEKGFEGSTGGEGMSPGTFRTTITNTQPGTFKVTAKAKNAGINSNTVTVTFGSAPSDTVKEVSELQLITDKPQIGTGSTEGALITAIIKDKSNNLVEGATVSFSSCIVDPNQPDKCLEGDAGELQAIAIEGGSGSTPGVTDVSGRAQARLTVQVSAENRTIKVTASTPTTVGEPKSNTVLIAVAGTTITISGPTSVVIGAAATFVITLKDFEGNGISNQTLNVASLLNNPFNVTTPKTDLQGRAEVIYTALNSGEDTITVSKQGVDSVKHDMLVSDDDFTIVPEPITVDCPAITDNEDINNNRLLDEGEDLNDNGKLDLGCQVPLNGSQGFKVHWDKSDAAQTNKTIDIFTTRGILSSREVITDGTGNAIFTLSPGGDAGNAVVTARAQEGPSLQFNVKFVAKNPTRIDVQANPPVINANPVGENAEQSDILAIVRDAENNLVFGKRVDFVLKDVSGGRLSQSFAFTDDFGQARTTYIAGTSSSGADGVVITALVAENPSVTKSVNITVAQKSLFIDIGTGNKLEPDPPLRYKVPFTLLVTDSNGTPMGNADVTLSIYPATYLKGYVVDADSKKVEIIESLKERLTNTTDPIQQDAIKLQIELVDSLILPTLGGGCQPQLFKAENVIINSPCVCNNEDLNRNGILDSGEDFNGNTALDPGNVLTVDNLRFKTSTGEAETTAPKGFADFKMIYAISYAMWVTAEITARAVVTGSEGVATMYARTVCLKEDYDAGLCPLAPPFGTGQCSEPN